MGAAAALVPFVSQINPDAATLAAGGPVELDLKTVAPGQQVVVRWRSRPVFVTHRTAAALQKLRDPALLAPIPNQLNCSNRLTLKIGIARLNPTSPAVNWPGGYFCPCHGSKYDLAGRVFHGVPAPYNLPVPHFLSDTMIRIGENQTNSNFEFASIRQFGSPRLFLTNRRRFDRKSVAHPDLRIIAPISGSG